MYKEDLILNRLQKLMGHKTQPNQTVLIQTMQWLQIILFI